MFKKFLKNFKFYFVLFFRLVLFLIKSCIHLLFMYGGYRLMLAWATFVFGKGVIAGVIFVSIYFVLVFAYGTHLNLCEKFYFYIMVPFMLFVPYGWVWTQMPWYMRHRLLKVFMFYIWMPLMLYFLNKYVKAPFPWWGNAEEREKYKEARRLRSFARWEAWRYFWREFRAFGMSKDTENYKWSNTAWRILPVDKPTDNNSNNVNNSNNINNSNNTNNLNNNKNI